MGGFRTRVLRHSSLYETLENGILLKDRSFPSWQQSVSSKEYLPLRPFVAARLTLKQNVINYRLSRTKRIVENAFGIMASKFRIFEKSMASSPHKVTLIVRVCCALHNFLRLSETQDRSTIHMFRRCRKSWFYCNNERKVVRRGRNSFLDWLIILWWNDKCYTL